jgi:hypothetical protein
LKTHNFLLPARQKPDQAVNKRLLNGFPSIANIGDRIYHIRQIVRTMTATLRESLSSKRRRLASRKKCQQDEGVRLDDQTPFNLRNFHHKR